MYKTSLYRQTVCVRDTNTATHVKFKTPRPELVVSEEIYHSFGEI